jgi:hypothetical protein
MLPFTLNILAMFRLHKKVISLQQTNYLVSKNKNLLGNLTETILLAIITGKRVQGVAHIGPRTVAVAGIGVEEIKLSYGTCQLSVTVDICIIGTVKLQSKGFILPLAQRQKVPETPQSGSEL